MALGKVWFLSYGLNNKLFWGSLKWFGNQATRKGNSEFNSVYYGVMMYFEMKDTGPTKTVKRWLNIRIRVRIQQSTRDFNTDG